MWLGQGEWVECPFSLIPRSEGKHSDLMFSWGSVLTTLSQAQDDPQQQGKFPGCRLTEGGPKTRHIPPGVPRSPPIGPCPDPFDALGISFTL